MTVPGRGKEGYTGQVQKHQRGPKERRAILRRIVHPASGEVLDEGIVLYFPRELCSPSKEAVSRC